MLEVQAVGTAAGGCYNLSRKKKKKVHFYLLFFYKKEIKLLVLNK